MRPPRKPRVGVSACLLGQAVRWDGGHRRDAWCVEVLGPLVEWVPVCPEVEVGMPVPRPPIQLAGRASAPRLLEVGGGEDWTARMRALAEARVAALEALDLSGFVLKEGSPSCGLARVPVHGPRGGAPSLAGVGAFSRVLLERLPLLPVEEAARLRDRRVREAFVERIFAYGRWRAHLVARLVRAPRGP